MDYLNPTSIAQMAQVPKDTSLPGTGYGLVQGFNEGQAMERAKDFLDMSKAAQAQNYVKNQFDMQTAWEDYPLDREQKQANLAQTQSSTKVNQETLAKMAREAKQFGMEGQLSIMASMKDKMRAAKTPMERAALYHSTINRIRQGGFEPDEDLLNINPMEESQAQSLIDYYDAADAITTYNADTRRGIAKDMPKIKSAEGIARDDRASKERMNRDDNETAKLIAGIRADAQTAATGGTQELNRWKANLFARWEKTLTKDPKTWTAEERAINTVASRALASQFTTADEITNNPQRQGEVAGQRKEQGMRGVMKGLDSLNTPQGQSDAFGDPSVINRGVNPPTQIEGTQLPSKVLRYDNKGNLIQ